MKRPRLGGGADLESQSNQLIWRGQFLWCNAGWQCYSGATNPLHARR
ncbi:hypothetical protein RBSH_00129 [Rhodopirellula baltica SH28]|uniref:Uncharacterized protein n=1 Tax=Rhodopirellula baltica SH28 TaxID=993517 RepID=K5DNQ8_RHOBT|nr:hypothetical protein RBSH_00129 [Rhodopirellula baltica SH28]